MAAASAPPPPIPLLPLFLSYLPNNLSFLAPFAGTAGGMRFNSTSSVRPPFQSRCDTRSCFECQALGVLISVPLSICRVLSPQNWKTY